MKTLFTLSVLFISMGSVLSAQTVYDFPLSGTEMVPRVQTPGMGSMQVWIESDTLYVRGTFSDLRDTYFAAHIHYGKRGETGNRIFRLRATLNDDKRSGEFREEDNKFHLRPVQRSAITNGNFYMTISSNRHQQGELRGQIPRF
ncbi:MAG: CHRD domain-containing protein [Balneolaceae bacterium]|nr:CHRD domain-containing protein [Balneolaceae bacterium]